MIVSFKQKLKFLKMKKKLLFFIVLLTIYSCQNNDREIPTCKLDVQNGITYTDGKVFNGKCNIFYSDTLLWKTRTYKRGMEVKEISYYVPGGEIEYVGYKKNGLVHGDFVSYYPNGEVSIEGELEQSKYQGEWNYYDDDGSLNKTINYDDEGVAIDTIYHK